MLSIIIPTYNSENTIKKCLNSIIKIKNMKYEIILIDDGSTDRTPSINNTYARHYKNIYAFYQKNHGVSVARNNGIKHANGKWLCFIDSDDYINPINLEKTFNNYVTSQDFDLIQSNIILNNKILSKKKQIYTNTKYFLQDNYPLYGNEIIQTVWSKFYKLSIINNYNISFPKNINKGEDFIFNLKYLMHTKKIIQVNLPFYYYSIHKNSITKKFENNPFKSKFNIVLYLKEIYNYYNLSPRSMNWIHLKAVYSILLNTLSAPSYINKLKLLKIYKNKIKYYYIPNRGYKTFENNVLKFFLLQPSTLLLLLFIQNINILRNIIHYFK